MELRQYQSESLDALDSYLNEGLDGALLEIATGCGKSLIMAELCQRLVRRFPAVRIVSVTHVQELIAQNHDELLSLWISAPAGIYSAGLNKRDARSQITFCGIQSVHDKPELFGSVDLLMIDEAHLVPKKTHTMYGKFIAALRKTNPDMRLVGLTATPYRLGTGRLDEGDDRLFERTVYTYGIADGVRDGYLAPLSSKGMETRFDLTGVKKSGGEYVEKQLQAAVDRDDITERAVAEAVAYGRERRSWLAFCSGVAHAFHVRDAVRRRGFSCETIVGTTAPAERARIIADFKAERIRCLTNNSVLTTGFNAPGVDMIMALRPTASPGLYVQMMGRGTRLAPDKDKCLVLDYARLVETHGPIDEIRAPRAKGGGPAPIKECPSCHELIRAAARECPECGHVFEPLGVPNQPKITAKASNLSIMSSSPPTWLTVTGRKFAAYHKPDSEASVCVTFKCGAVPHKRWYNPDIQSKGHYYADRFWLDHGGNMPVPRSADAWLERQDELRPTEQISVKPDGKYIRVDGTKAAAAIAFDPQLAY